MDIKDNEIALLKEDLDAIISLEDEIRKILGMDKTNLYFHYYTDGAGNLNSYEVEDLLKSIK